MIDVLLISPRLPQTDSRYCGDHAYTDALLQCPPPGVRYYHHEDLLATGAIRKIKWLYRIGPRLVRWNVLPPDLWAEYLISDFVPDLVHIMGFSAVIRFPNRRKPVPAVVEVANGSVIQLLEQMRWSLPKVHRAHYMKRLYLKSIGAYDSSLNSEQAKCIIVQSEYSRHFHINYSGVAPEKIVVLPPPIPVEHKGRRIERKDKVHFLFVGGDFDRKNGWKVLEAYQQVRKQYPRINLTIVGKPADGVVIKEEGVVHYQRLSRDALLREVFPTADVFVLPTGLEGGFSVAIIEAMAFGLATITVDAWAMRELVVPGKTGLLIPYPPSTDSLVAAMVSLIQSSALLRSMQQEALLRFQRRFSPEKRQKRLAKIYQGATA